MSSTTARSWGDWIRVMRFIDTNVLLYAVCMEPDNCAKRDKAVELLQAVDVALSVQVMAEFYSQATRPSRTERLTSSEAVEILEGLRRFPVQDLTPDLLHAAVSASERFQIDYWDAAIIEAARTLGCNVVLSEDLSDSRDYAGVRVENPFRGS
jgi:predicted nucleic acid-binding protein